jgi:iron complex transport system substrate-binding protein
VTRFALVPRGTRPVIEENCTVIETPVRSVICMTSLQLSGLIALGRTDAVVGITSTRHLVNPGMRARIDDGRTARIGIEGNFDPEVIMAVEPDLIIISPYKRGGYDALREVGIPLLPHFGYQETTPLGQAEWIKCIGELTGDRAVADSLFDGIEQRYEALRELASGVAERPSVLSGELRGGNWYAVGGESYLARMFGDAGADYFLADDTRAGGAILDFESVYARASGTRYWRILNSFDGEFSYDVLRRQDGRYADFRAWRERGIIYCNMNDGPFYESTPVEPDVVLADFIKVFHPELLPDHRPVYYRLLR